MKHTWILVLAACTGGGYQHQGFSESRHGSDYIAQGVAQMELKHYDEALRLFNLATQDDPGNPDAFYHRGNAWDMKDKPDLAIADYGEAIRIDRRHRHAWFKRGYVRYNRKAHNEAALSDLTEAIRLEPSFADALLWRGQVYRALKIFDAAVADFEQAAHLNPTNAAQAEAWLAQARQQDASPALQSVTAEGDDLGKVYVRFTRIVDPNSAANTAYYKMSDNVTVMGVTLDEDRRVVVLSVSGLLLFGKTTLSVSPSIKGISGNSCLPMTRVVQAANTYRGLRKAQ